MVRRGTARNQFVEDDIAGEMVLPIEITDTPANTMFFIPNEDGLKTTRTTLGT
jgi:hypothetical protein